MVLIFIGTNTMIRNYLPRFLGPIAALGNMKIINNYVWKQSMSEPDSPNYFLLYPMLNH
jgi:hypothetical protein